MSGREGQGGQGQEGEDQGGKQTYVVKTDFTDDKGKHWSVGTAFQGDEDAIRKALAAGRIAQKPETEPKA